MFQYLIQEKTFDFQFDARTSRGPLKQRKSWFIRLSHADYPGIEGIGECGPLPGLSPENLNSFEKDLLDFSEFVLPLLSTRPRSWERVSAHWLENWKSPWLPSVVFGWEMAWLDWVNGGKKLICDLGFWSGNWAIPINGLVWMNGFDHMLAEARIKVAQGFDTIKIKVGSLAWKEEFELIQQLRTEFPPDKITIRIDANGSWNPTEALERLSELAPFSIHSVEQPIATGHWQEMAKLCQKSPIPVALDEELIGHFLDHQKYSLLESIPAAFLVLKPTLLGGLGQTHQWIKMAEEMDMDWWITSMLESNVGLNAIAQLAAQYHPSLPQGLGTGGLYSKNFPSPLIIENGELKVDKSLALEIQKLD